MTTNQFNIIFPSNKRQILDGGLNDKFERSIIDDRESPSCQNVIFDNASVGTREGVTKFNTASVGSFINDGLYTRRDRTGAETMVAFFGGTAWQAVGTTFTTISSAQSVFTAGVRVAGTQYENHLFVGNGFVVPYKWNGTDWTRHGVYPPTTTLTVASNGTGNLAGDYRYKITFVNSQVVESDVGPASATFTVSSPGRNNLTSIPTAAQSWGISARNIYRTNASGSVFFRIATLSDNTTTIYTDNIASSSVGVSAPVDNGVPPFYNVAIYHQNRLFVNDASNPNFVWYSDLGEPYTFETTNFDTFGDASGDLIKGFAIFDNSLIVFCENSQWIWYMEDTDPSNWRKVQIRSSYGSKSPFAAVRYQNKVLFPAFQNSKLVGFAAIAGDSIEPSATLLTVSAAGSELQSDRIEPDIFNIQTTYVGNISAIVHKNKIYITVTYGGSQTANNRVYVLDFSISDLNRKNPAWSPFLTLNATQFTVYAGDIYYGSSLADGFVQKINNAGTGVYSDNSAAIDSFFWTKEFSGLPGHQNMEKDFRWLNLLVDKAGAYYMNVTYRVDSDKGAGTTVQVNLNPGSSIWGVLVWGVGDWGGGTDQEDVTIPLGTARGKRIQFRFDNQDVVNQRFKVHGMNFTYNIRGQR